MRVRILLLILQLQLLVVVASPSGSADNVSGWLNSGSTVGLIKVYKKNDQFNLVLNDSLLGRDILAFTRIVDPGTATRVGLRLTSPGSKTADEQIIRFIKKNDSTIVLQKITLKDKNPVAVISSFKINSSINGKEIAIDITGLFNNEDETFFFAGKPPRWVGDYKKGSANIRFVQTYPSSIEIRTVRSYANTVLELHTSFLVLAKDPMPIRYSDARLSYFTEKIYDVRADTTLSALAITRWRMQPSAGTEAEYAKRRLVVPQNPIIFYIDPATPRKWVPYFIAAVEDWREAFEEAGFKDAIKAEVVKDSAFQLYNARVSVIHYVTSNSRDGSYATVVDPRSGEILQSDVFISTGSLMRIGDDYFVQASPSDTRARKATLDDTLMGELIRRVVSHEVGHVLGFDHNMIASNAVPVEKLRDAKWLRQNGITPSIMDYARYNYVAQSGDSVYGRKCLINTIGAYDKWAVKWGYYYIQNSNPEKDKVILTKWINKKLKDNVYRTSLGGTDARQQPESLGDDAMLAGKYGIRNLQYILKHLPEWVNSSKDALGQRFDIVVRQYSIYLSHVVANIGGVYISPDANGNNVTSLVPLKIQEKALAFLDEELFTTPAWLIDSQMLATIGINDTQLVGKLQTDILGHLLSSRILGQMVIADSLKQKSIDPDAFLRQIRRIIFREMYTSNPIDRYRRALQLKHVNYLVKLATRSPMIQVSGESVAVNVKLSQLAKQELAELQQDIAGAKLSMKSPDDITFLSGVSGLISTVNPH